MPDEEIIPLEIFCSSYHVEQGFVDMLEMHGLIAVSYRENRRFILLEDLPDLEKYTRLFYDLNINAEGIDALNHLLEKIKLLQQEADSLKARLRIYE